MNDMRLYKRGKYYYIEFRRGVARTTGTSDKRLAEQIFRNVKREYLKGRLLQLDVKKNITLAEFTSEYLKTREYVGGKTYKQDELALRLLADVIKPTIPLRSISERNIAEFRNACLARKVKPVSVDSYLRHIKAALNTAVKWKLLKEPPAIKIPTRKKYPKYLEKEDVEALLSYTKRNKFELWRIILFGLYTGCRRKEMLNLRWEHCNLKSKKPTAKIIGKGDRERTIPLLPKALEAMGEPRNIGRVFADIKHDTLTHWVHKAGRECGVSATVHKLRHTCATYMIMNGVNLKAVQEILGHAQISTTMIYVGMVAEHLHDEAEKLNYD